MNFLLYDPFQPVPTISYYGGLDNLSALTFGPVAYQNTVQGQQSFTASDNLTKVTGKHTLKAGVDFRRNNLWSASGYGYNIGFSGYDTADPVTYLGGSGLATFLLGYVGQGGPSSGVQYAPWQTNDNWGLYGQDDFRVRPNFTLSFGLRWDVMGWIRERHNALANINFGEPNPDAPSYMGRLEYMGSQLHPDRNVFPANKNSFGPRFGFSWSPGSSGKTVIRGGYGMVYSNSMSAVFGQGLGAVSTPGFSVPVSAQVTDPTYTKPSFILSQGAPTLILPDLTENQKNQAQLLGKFMFPFEKAPHDPAVQQWSLFVQRELPGNMMISGGYVGSHGTHLMGDEISNVDIVPTKTQQELRSRINNNYPGDPAIAPLYGCDVDPNTGKSMCPGYYSLERYPQYYAIAPQMRPDGINKYHSAQFRFEKRPSHGLSFLVAYTISKNIVSAGLGALVANTTGPTTISSKGVGRIAFIPGAAGGGVADGSTHTWANDPDNRRAAISLSPDDTPQVFNVAATYEFPLGKGKRFMNQGGLANALFGGWKWTQNWNAQSGVPMFFSSCCARNGLYSYRLNQIGDPSAGRSSNRIQQEQQYYNGNAFTPPYGPDQALITALSNGVYADGTPVNYDTVDSYWAIGNASIRPPGGRTPGYWNMDMALAKSFYLTESRFFTFRWDIFNAFNHMNLGVPNSSWCLPPNPDGSTDLVHQFGCQFGRITNIQTDPRGMQFSIRFQF